jgi:predicted nucleic acid-binding protein
MIRTCKIELAWSYILDFENEANPFFERKYTIEKWKTLSKVDVHENSAILSMATKLGKQGLKAKDALHISCAIEMHCEFFLTTDDLIQKRMLTNEMIRVFNPIEFIKVIENI